MKLNGLKNIYKDITTSGLSYAVFYYRTNGIKFNIYFDIFQTPSSLLFKIFSSNSFLRISAS